MNKRKDAWWTPEKLLPNNEKSNNHKAKTSVMGLTPKLITTVAQVAATAQTEKGIPFHPLLKM